MKNKHLTLDNRLTIQAMLTQGCTFTEIASALGKHPSTISKEILKHITIPTNSYTIFDEQGNILNEECPLTKRPPYVCNGCPRKCSCRRKRQMYNGKKADKVYRENLTACREGIPLNKEEFYELDKLITAELAKGRHLYQIMQAHNIKVPESTIYRWASIGYFSFSALDLPRKVKFKNRKPRYIPYVPKAAKEGRTYEDFLAYKEEHNLLHWEEMDTVIGAKGGKVVLTLHFTSSNFMLGLLLDSKSAYAVTMAVNGLKTRLARYDIRFGDVFPVILTDNGGEFSNIQSIECDLAGHKETKLFFCDPMASHQKGKIEKNHTLFRDICPKGTSFNNFTQDALNIIFSHVNSTSRKIFNGKTPFEMFTYIYGEDLAEILGIKAIAPKDVMQTPALLKELKKAGFLLDAD